MQDRGRPPRTRGRSYAEIIQQLSGQVDSLQEALSQLQLENRDLKLRQEVLEQWCRINRLALQVMHTCGGVLMRGQQQDLPQAAIAAIESAEEWIQQQLVEFGPVAADEATELPPPRAGSGSSDSCILQGLALSLMEYAMRYLLAHPQRYAHVSGLDDPDAALAQVAGCREQVRRLLAGAGALLPPIHHGGNDAGCADTTEQTADEEGHAACAAGSTGGLISGPAALTAIQDGVAPMDCAGRGSSHQQQPLSAGTDTPVAALEATQAAAAAAAAAAREADLPGVMLHLLTLIACAQLLDPAITYRCVHRVYQLAGPLTPAKLQAMVAPLQLSDEQRAQIAARVRVVSQLLAPVNAAWDGLMQDMRQVLLSMQQQQQQAQTHMPGLTPGAAVAAVAALQPQAPQGGAGGVPHVDATAASASSLSQPAPRVATPPSQQGNAAAGAMSHASSTVVAAVAEAAAADLHTRLSHLVQRLNTMHRTLGWLEMTQGYAGLGVLSWQQMGQLLVVTEPYPLLPRYVMNYIAAQWEEEHGQAGASTSSGGRNDGAHVVLPHQCAPRSSSEEVSLEASMTVGGPQPPPPPPQQQQQQRPVASVRGAIRQGAHSSCPPRPARHRARTGKGVLPPDRAGPKHSMQLLPGGGGGGASWPCNSSQAYVFPTANALGATHNAWAAPPNLLQDYSDMCTRHCGYHHHEQQQQQQQQQHQQQPAPAEGPVVDTAQEGVGGSSLLPYAGGGGLAVAPDPLAHHVSAMPQGPQRGGLLQSLLQLCDLVVEGGPQGVQGQEERAGAALDALLDMLLE